MWTVQEIEILRSNYPSGGYYSCASLLPSKTRGAINSKAFRLGIVVDKAVKEEIAKIKGTQNLQHERGEKNHNWKGGKQFRDCAEYKRKTKAKYPEREKARDAVRVAIRKGHLVRTPCQICGLPNSEAHHEDYTKPLNVVFLCRKHHAEADKNRKIQ